MPSVAAAGNGVLGPGQHGPAVRQLQQNLNRAGANPPLDEDGNFGPKTTAAVRHFQQQHGLNVDGLAGPETVRALAASFAAPAHTVPALHKTRFEFDEHVSPTDSNRWPFSRQLLAQGDHYRLDTPAGVIQLIVQKGYLDDAALQKLGNDLYRARVEVPRFFGEVERPLGPITVYVFGADCGAATEAGLPISNASAVGLKSGEPAMDLRKVKKGRAPIFHEMAHLLRQRGETSESLSEGFADYVQYTMQPDRGVGFRPDGLDVNQAAREALAEYPELLDAIGSKCSVTFEGPRRDGDGKLCEILDDDGKHQAWNRTYAADARAGFYYASHSFVKFLVARHGIGRVAELLTAGGGKRDYRRILGESHGEMRRVWRRKIEHA